MEYYIKHKDRIYGVVNENEILNEYCVYYYAKDEKHEKHEIKNIFVRSNCLHEFNLGTINVIENNKTVSMNLSNGLHGFYVKPIQKATNNDIVCYFDRNDVQAIIQNGIIVDGLNVHFCDLDGIDETLKERTESAIRKIIADGLLG